MGGEIFHQMLLRRRVKHTPGYPGGAILPISNMTYSSPHRPPPRANAIWVTAEDHSRSRKTEIALDQEVLTSLPLSKPSPVSHHRQSDLTSSKRSACLILRECMRSGDWKPAANGTAELPQGSVERSKPLPCCVTVQYRPISSRTPLLGHQKT